MVEGLCLRDEGLVVVGGGGGHLHAVPQRTASNTGILREAFEAREVSAFVCTS